MRETVLILNKNFYPIDLLHYTSVISKVFEGDIKAMDVRDFSLHNWESWLEVSKVFFTDNTYRILRSPSTIVVVPEIAVAIRQNYIPMTKLRFTSELVHVRDQKVCQICGKKNLQEKEISIEHIIPRRAIKEIRNKTLSMDELVKLSGRTYEFIRRLVEHSPNDWENCQTACGHCNSKKSDKIIHVSELKKLPYKPAWADKKVPKKFRVQSPPESWRKFLTQNLIVENN